MNLLTVRTTTILLAIIMMAACSTSPKTKTEVVLLYSGSGSSKNDTIAVAKLIRQSGFEYVAVGSRQLDDMTESELAEYGLIVFAGGNYIEMGDSLAPATAQRLRQAVSKGLN